MINIRMATEKDIVSMAEVHKKTWQTTYADLLHKDFLDSLSINNSIKGISKTVNNKNVISIVAEYKAKIIGFACAGSNRNPKYCQFEGELFGIYILREHARHGLGKRMFKKIVKSLQEQGKHSIIIWMLKGNSAEYFYKKMSTVKVGEEAKIIGGKEYPIIAYGMKDIKKIFDC